MLNPNSPLAALMSAKIRPGRIGWIGLRPARRAPMVAVDRANFERVKGLLGDRYAGGSGNRQVTLIQSEHLIAIAAYVGRNDGPWGVTPDLLRRNIVTIGINLQTLVGEPFRVGTAVLRGTGLCHPCSRMEEVLGEGGYNAVRGHGGITARVIEPGVAEIGDSLERSASQP